MSENLDGIDLNYDAVTVEAINDASGVGMNRSVNETLTENNPIDMGLFKGPSSVDGSRVLGEAKDPANGVSEGLNREIGVKNGDLEGKKGIKNDGFVNWASSVDGFRVLGESKDSAIGVSGGVNREIGVKNGDLEGKKGSVGREMGIKNYGFVSWASSVNGFRVFREAKDSANVVSEGVNGVGKGDLEGKYGSVGREMEINNDGFVTGVKVNQGKDNADSVYTGGERQNDVARVAETRSSNVLQEALTAGAGETEGKITSDENNVVGVVVPVGNVTRINPVADLNARHGAGKEHLSGNGIGSKGTEVKEVLNESNVSSYDGGVNIAAPCNKGVGPNENQDAVIKEQMTHVRLEGKDGNDFKVVALRPKIRGEESRTEKEGEYYLSDLVWGKVRGHPWWPGQIFEPSAASEKAMKHFKKDSYLIAYFGDQTFAWNEAARIKPFRMHFSQMEKQSNVEAFYRAVDCALDEVSRRVEFGLSCSCLHEEQRAKIASQTVVSAGILEETSTRYGGDNISSASTFVPVVFLHDFKSLAAAPNSGIDRLRFVIARAQLLAFYRWKGFYQLPELVELDGLSEKDADIPALEKEEEEEEEEEEDEDMDDEVEGSRADGEASSGKVQLGIRDNSSQKRKHGSGRYECLRKKEKSATDLVSGRSSVTANGENKSKGKRGRKRGSLASNKKHEAIESISSDSKFNRRKRILSPSVQKESPSRPEKFYKVGERVARFASQLGGSTHTLESGQNSSQIARGIDGQKLVDADIGFSACSTGKSQMKKLFAANIPPPEEMLSKLFLAALDPMEQYTSIYSYISFFSTFRNSVCLQHKNAQKRKKSAEEHKGENSSKSETVEIFGFEGIEDSYWTDRVIQSNYEEQVLSEKESLEEKTTPNFEPGNGYNASPNLDSKQERDAGVPESDAENLAVSVDENTEEYSPTALSLKFNKLESVPSVMDLNNIFSRYGPLNESQTEVLSKSKRAKVVFKRRSDAEAAFSSAGKFSIFGPSLLCYRLKPLPVKAPTVTKRNRKGAKSA